jgi:hypothetical protein
MRSARWAASASSNPWGLTTDRGAALAADEERGHAAHAVSLNTDMPSLQDIAVAAAASRG